jgi:aryl-alcohol dehydrogenase-like predicted oxidoreductase
MENESPFYIGPPELGLQISSPIGVGLWAWGDSITWGYEGYDSETTEETLKAALQASLSAG